MFKHNIRIFRRLLFKNPAYSLVSFTGLVLAFATTILIALHLRHELSYDRFHHHAEDIYRVAWFGANPQTRTPHPMAAAMKAEMPEVTEAVSLSPLYGPGLTKAAFRFKNPQNNIVYDEPEGYLVDSTFFKVFDFEFVSGGPETLKQVGALLITEGMAQRFFGEEDPMGKILAFGNDENPLQVAAVLKDPPSNSHFRFNYLISYVTTKAFNPGDNWYKWGDFGHFNYLRLSPGTDHKTVEAKLPTWIQKYVEGTDEQMRQLESGEIGFRLQPITSIHLNSHIRWELDENSDQSYIYLYGLSALFILLISAINFVNLNTARSMERLKEVGIKKTLGAVKGALFRQFLTEALLTVAVALLLAFVVANALIPAFNELVKGQVSSQWSGQLWLMPWMLLMGLIISFVASSYPAFYLNAIDPGKILKGLSPNSLGGGHARNILLGIQFFMTLLLVSGSLIIQGQIKFLKEKELGFDKENTVVVRIKEDDEIVPRLETVKAELKANPQINKVTAVSNVPGGQFNHNPVFPKNDPENQVTLGEFLVDYDTFDALGLEMASGRNFQKQFLSDSAGTSYILNETAVKRFNLTNPVGQRLMWDDDDQMREGTIVGVVKDFHFKSLHEAISPIIMQIYPDDYNFLLIKTQGGALEATLDHIQQIYAKYDPLNSFEYYLLDASIANLYREESRTLDLATLFAAISIFLSLAGLIGVASLVIRKRIKEIGIRKVLGASLHQLLWILTRKYLVIALLSLAVAIPFSYYLLNQWLNGFTYQQAINPLLFVVTGVGLIAIIMATISGISMRVSRSNPVQSLRQE